MKRLQPVNVLSIVGLLIIFVFALIATHADALEKLGEAAQKQLSVQQVKADLALMKEVYERVHPGYTRYAKKTSLDTTWDAIEQRAEQNNGLTLGEFYLEVQQALTAIRCDHTKANLPKSMLKERDEQPMYLPFRWTWIQGRAFIRVVPPSIDLNKHDEILAIDGRPIDTLVAKVKQYIPYDGNAEWSRQSGIAESLEFKGGALDHFGALLWPIQAEVELTIKQPDGLIKKVLVTRVNHQQWTALEGKNASGRNFKDAVQLQRIGANIAYLRIDTFVNYRQPVDPADIYDPIFKSIKEEKRDILILDLRHNGGGSTDASHGLLANLISESVQATSDMRTKTLNMDGIREHLWTWDKRALDPYRIAFRHNEDDTYSLRSWFSDDLDTINPARYAFTGKIIALTSKSNSSGSTNLLAAIQAFSQALLVGEKTGGSAQGPTAGVLFTLTLPESKITTRVPYFQSFNNIVEFEFGMGVMPDVEVSKTVEDYLSGHDSALTKAISLAKAD